MEKGFYFWIEADAWDNDVQGPFPTLQAARADFEEYMPGIISQFGDEVPDDRKFWEHEPDSEHGLEVDAPHIATEAMYSNEVTVYYFHK